MSEDVRLHRWKLWFGQCSSRHIGRVLQRRVISVFWHALLCQQAIFPSGFRLQVGWLTQERNASELLLSLKGIYLWVRRRTSSA